MLRRWFPLWLVLLLAPVGLGQTLTRLDPVAVDSASLLPVGLSGRYAPAQAGEPAHRAWHFRGAVAGPAQLVLNLTLALGGPDDRLDLAIAYDNTSWIPIGNVRWRVGPQEIDLSPWVRPGRFRVRLSLVAQRPERCWFSDLSWRGSGVASDSPQEQWLPEACWWQPALAALRDRREPMGLPPGAEVPAGGGRVETTPVADWEPCAAGWRARGLSLPRGEQVALVLDGQADGAGLRLGRTVEVSHRLPFAPVGLVLDAETLANPPSLVVTTKERPKLRAIATGPLMLRYASVGSFGGDDRWPVVLSAVVTNSRGGPVDGRLALTVSGPGGFLYRFSSRYRFPPGHSQVLQRDFVANPPTWPAVCTAEWSIDDGQRCSDNWAGTTAFAYVDPRTTDAAVGAAVAATQEAIRGGRVFDWSNANHRFDLEAVARFRDDLPALSTLAAPVRRP